MTSLNTPKTNFAPVTWLESDPRTRHLFFPMASTLARGIRDLSVQNAGFDFLQTRYRAGTPCSPTHLLYYNCDGEISCDWGDGVRQIRPKEIAVCPAGTSHWISIESGTAKALWIHLHNVERWKFLHRAGPCIRASQEAESLASAMEQAIVESRNLAFGGFETASHYAAIAGILLLRELGQDSSARDRQAREKLATLWAEVGENLERKWTVAEMAALIHVSSGYLYQLSAKHAGMAPMEMVTRLRMERAMDLLLHDDSTLEVIASEVGYNSAFSFSEAFFRQTGRRPGAFRGDQRKT